MPFFSIIVPVYNTQEYLAACLDSLLSQTFDDIEIVVVNDASTDGSADIIADYEAKDPRVLSVRHEENKGLHSARKSGVAKASGDYILFVDSDDEFADDACEKLHERLLKKPVDILHFGPKVIGDTGVSEEAAREFEQAALTNIGYLSGDDIIRVVYDEEEGYRQDWRIIHRIFEADLLKRAFDAMPDYRLNRAEDSYEYFVIASLAQTADSADDIQGYIYYYGRGITGEAIITREQFRDFCAQFKACFDATEEYVRSCDRAVLDTCYEGYVAKSLELLSNDWLTRVREWDKPDAMGDLASVFGEKAASRECYRFLRDRAYELLQDDDHALLSDDPLFLYKDLAEAFEPYEPDKDDLSTFQSVRDEALYHLNDLFKRERQRAKIKLFVATHKEAVIPRGRFIIPVQVGAAQAAERFPLYCYDDDGDNISEKNPTYCEMTAQYWAWKNTDAEYYGFCHYRRYFDFSSIEHEENPFGEIMDDHIDAETIDKYSIDDAGILAAVYGYDVVTTGINDVADFPGDFTTMREHYDDARFLHVSDLDTMADIVKEKHPDYAQDVDTFLAGSKACFCNMYILRREIFFAYCEWLFPLLEEFENRVDMSLYNVEAQRTPGHLAERLFNIYYIHQMRTGAEWKTKQLQCVHFEHPEPYKSLGRAFDGTAVPVVFAADNNYVPQLTVAMYSVVANSSPDRYYDLVVLSRDITGVNAEHMFRCLTHGRSNISVRFYDVSDIVKNYKLEANAHISTETYYRFLVQSVLPGYDKVLYLDSDLIAEVDVADLFDTELGDNLIAAVPDPDFTGNLNLEDGERLKYAKEVLHMKDPYTYFQAGVLVMNTKAMRHLYPQDEWLRLAAVPHIYNDQDILNEQCDGRVTFLDYTWNVMVDTGRYDLAIAYAPADQSQAYIASRGNPKIVHYAGYLKPWDDLNCDFGQVFWRYARQTPFYEELVLRLSMKRVHDDEERLREDMYRYITERLNGERAVLPAFSEDMYRYVLDRFNEERPITNDVEEHMYRFVVNRHAQRSFRRKVGDVFLPYGSKRREFFKRLAGRG